MRDAQPPDDFRDAHHVRTPRISANPAANATHRAQLTRSPSSASAPQTNVAARAAYTVTSSTGDRQKPRRGTDGGSAPVTMGWDCSPARRQDLA